MDPLTIAALIKAGSSIAKGVQANKMAKEQIGADLTRAGNLSDQARTMRDDAIRRRGQYGLSKSFSDLRNRAMEDPASDFLRQQALRQEGSTLGALRAGGARALIGGAGAVAQSTQDSLAKIEGDRERRIKEALATVGQAESVVDLQKLTDARGDLNLGRALGAEADSLKFGAQDADRLRRFNRNQAITEGVGSLGMAGAAEAGLFKGADAELMKMFMEKGGLVRGKTPGEFSHEDNPIDIVQEGEKIGEMTGGEGIVSPKDMGLLEQLAGDGDTALHKFVRDWIKRVNKDG